MSDLIVCQALLNSGSLSTGGPEVSRSQQGCLSPSVSSQGRQGEKLEEVRWRGGRKQAGMVLRYLSLGDPPSDILKFFYSSLAAWYLLPKVEIQKNQKTPCCLAVFNIKSIFPSNNVFHIVPLLC